MKTKPAIESETAPIGTKNPHYREIREAAWDRAMDERSERDRVRWSLGCATEGRNEKTPDAQTRRGR